MLNRGAASSIVVIRLILVLLLCCEQSFASSEKDLVSNIISIRQRHAIITRSRESLKLVLDSLKVVNAIRQRATNMPRITRKCVNKNYMWAKGVAKFAETTLVKLEEYLDG